VIVNTDLLVPSSGFFTRVQALQHGESDRSLREAVRDGVLVRLRHGAYAFADRHAALDEAGRHLVMARAAVAAQQGRVALTGPSAALLHGLEVWGHDLSLVHLLRLDPAPPRRQAGVVHHAHSVARVAYVRCYDGIPAVSPARAAWEVARLSGLESAVVTFDSVLRRHPGSVDVLHDLARRQTSHRGSRTARLALRLARGQAESVGESLTRMACYRAAIPEPTLQYEVRDQAGRLLGRADFYWERCRHLGEFDGRVKYERLLKPGQSVTDAVLGEKNREDAMRATERGMTRFVWSGVLPGSTARAMAGLAHDLDRSHTLYVRGR
jgi:hypothetical protein